MRHRGSIHTLRPKGYAPEGMGLSLLSACGCVRCRSDACAALGGGGVEGSDPPVRRPGTGAGPCAFSHARPHPLRGRSPSNYPCTKAIEPTARGTAVTFSRFVGDRATGDPTMREPALMRKGNR